MNSWTYFRHGDGGGPVGEFEQDIKEFPDVPGEVIDVLVERAVVNGKEAQLPVIERDELSEVRRADLVQVVGGYCAYHPHVQERLSSTKARRDLVGRITRKRFGWLVPLTSGGGGQGLDLPGGRSGVSGVGKDGMQEVVRGPFDERFRVTGDRGWGRIDHVREDGVEHRSGMRWPAPA